MDTLHCISKLPIAKPYFCTRETLQIWGCKLCKPLPNYKAWNTYAKNCKTLRNCICETCEILQKFAKPRLQKPAKLESLCAKPFMRNLRKCATQYIAHSSFAVLGMSLRHLTSGTFLQLWQTLSNGCPLRLELVAVGAGHYFNFVSFTSWSATHHNETVPVLTVHNWTDV